MLHLYLTLTLAFRGGGKIISVSNFTINLAVCGIDAYGLADGDYSALPRNLADVVFCKQIKLNSTRYNCYRTSYMSHLIMIMNVIKQITRVASS